MFLVIATNNILRLSHLTTHTHTHIHSTTPGLLRIFQHTQKIFEFFFFIVYSFSAFIRRFEHRISPRRRRHNTTSLSIYIICFDQITLKYTFLLTFYFMTVYLLLSRASEICLFGCVLFSLQLFCCCCCFCHCLFSPIGILLIGKV
jgi:hypothetical protein